ncbi:unnamed protein product [Lactuca virosa]|uniref:Uncharacterized protein n=1 Tax=Lactuca virosa TaxID=75947 RepID=A0AAU9NLE1_9ASTR|nr:unnamed protein product [Lactuca virosa]
MKAICVVAGVEGIKQVVKEQVPIGKINHGEPSSVVEQTQVMHASVKAFMETDFDSYLRLGELDLEVFSTGGNFFPKVRVGLMN